jgi:aryl-alcohol dehydrogenase-like predicted oxidoreductase
VNHCGLLPASFGGVTPFSVADKAMRLPSGTMDKITFGRTGLEVSRLGFGAAPIGFLKTEREQVGRILNLLLDSGVNLIDTAAMYEGSEEVIGEQVSHRRSEYVLVSKCGTKVPDVTGSPWSPELIRQTVDRALRRLRTDHLDVMLLHSCDLETLKKGDALAALVEAQTAGKIRHVGYSGDNAELVYAAGLPEVTVVQTSVNFLDQANLTDGLAACRHFNVGVIAKRPIANAAWLGAANREGIYKSYVQPYVDRLARLTIKPADFGFSGPDAWLEMALRFTLSQPGVHTAIIGTTKPDNAKKNVAIAEKGPLPEHVVQQLRSAFDQANADGTWIGQQ